jgi:hypothetical protein
MYLLEGALYFSGTLEDMSPAYAKPVLRLVSFPSLPAMM